MLLLKMWFDRLMLYAVDHNVKTPGAPLTYFIDGGGGEGVLFGSEILAKKGFFGSIKDAGVFLVAKKQ